VVDVLCPFDARGTPQSVKRGYSQTNYNLRRNDFYLFERETLSTVNKVLEWDLCAQIALFDEWEKVSEVTLGSG